jgi:nitrogen regulatory protein PII
MKLIVALIQPHKLPDVKKALYEGDGKIFVLDLPECTRIRTSESGKDAIG